MKRKHSVIDTDIHAVLNSRRVMDFLPEPWRTRYASGNRGAGHIGYWNPNGVMRSDTKLPDGSRIEGSPENLARHFFDVYDLEFGVLNVGSQHIGLSPEPDYAAAVVSAENSVMAADWLPADPRFRAAILVSPADPELAAQEIHRLGDHRGFAQVLMPSVITIRFTRQPSSIICLSPFTPARKASAFLTRRRRRVIRRVTSSGTRDWSAVTSRISSVWSRKVCSSSSRR
jgi:predicted TIM-barrel fold metal-dependent hydrolase